MAPDSAASYRIIRWVVPVDDRPHDFPMNGAILHVASRRPDTVEFWTLDTHGPLVDRVFQVVGTGQPFPSDWKHVGTALAADGELVWHLMEQQ
jgi:hypothetical protein